MFLEIPIVSLYTMYIVLSILPGVDGFLLTQSQDAVMRWVEMGNQDKNEDCEFEDERLGPDVLKTMTHDHGP